MYCGSVTCWPAFLMHLFTSPSLSYRYLRAIDRTLLNSGCRKYALGGYLDISSILGPDDTQARDVKNPSHVKTKQNKTLLYNFPNINYMCTHLEFKNIFYPIDLNFQTRCVMCPRSQKQ